MANTVREGENISGQKRPVSLEDFDFCPENQRRIAISAEDGLPAVFSGAYGRQQSECGVCLHRAAD